MGLFCHITGYCVGTPLLTPKKSPDKSASSGFRGFPREYDGMMYRRVISPAQFASFPRPCWGTHLTKNHDVKFIVIILFIKRFFCPTLSYPEHILIIRRKYGRFCEYSHSGCFGLWFFAAVRVAHEVDLETGRQFPLRIRLSMAFESHFWIYGDLLSHQSGYRCHCRFSGDSRNRASVSGTGGLIKFVLPHVEGGQILYKWISP